MSEQTYWESIKAEGGQLLDRLKELVHEGNVRRVVVQHEGKTVAEFPLTAGVLGALIAPVAAAIGAIVALLQDGTIAVEREQPEPKAPESTPVAGQ
jgi:Na+/phosphate symporter